MRNYLDLGNWNAICDRCGFKYKASDLRQEWTGLRVCDSCFETRHPMDFIQVREDNNVPPWTRPESNDVFVDTNDYWMTETGEWIVNQIELPLWT